MARRPRWGIRQLLATVIAVAAVAALVSSWHFASPGVSDLLGTRLSGAQARWQAEVRAARAAVRARKARTLNLRFRRLMLQSRVARKTAQLAARRAPSQAPFVEQEFDAWTTSWHRTHPGASLAEERVAWHAREGELGRIAAWEARQRRHVTTMHATDQEVDVGADETASPTGAANVAESTAASVPTADVIKGIHAPAPASEDAIAHSADHVVDEGADETASRTGAVAENTAAAVPTVDVIKGIHAPAPASEHATGDADMISIKPSAMDAQAEDDAPVPGAGEEPKEVEAPAVEETGASTTVGGAEAGTEEAAVKIEHELQAQVVEDEAQEERVEEKVEEGIKENVVKEEACCPSPSPWTEEEGKNKEEEVQLTPGERQKERVAEARREVAEHNAYWDTARMNMDKQPCVPATFWFDNTIDPRPRCKKPQATLSYDAPKVMPPEIPPEPIIEEGPGPQQTILGVPDGQPDFNGADAVIALHPFLGHNPTDLEERGGETRGSFSVVSAHTGFDNEGEVSLAVLGPPKVPRHATPRHATPRHATPPQSSSLN